MRKLGTFDKENKDIQMATPLPSFTRAWHSKSYAAIDPCRPELSLEGKVVVITGGGGVIGTALARSFALAHSRAIILIGRTEETLKASVSSIEKDVPGAKILYHLADISNETSIQSAVGKAEDQFGKLHILINNAGHLAPLGPTLSAKTADWWKSFEINVLGSFNATRAFLSHAVAEGVSIINISAGFVHGPAQAPLSSYTCSKLAAAKLLEYVQAENPALHTVNVHPGVVESDMTRMAGFPGMDDAQLSGDFAVWATSTEASFLKGKFVWANWDVAELKQQAEKIQSSSLLSLSLDGWPLQDST